MRELCRSPASGRFHVIGSSVETLPRVGQVKPMRRLTGLSAFGKSWLPLAAPGFPRVRRSRRPAEETPDHRARPPTRYDAAAQPRQPARSGHDEEKPYARRLDHLV